METGKVIRVVIFKEGDLFIAQGLEVDICAQGSSPEDAGRKFGIALNAEAQEARDKGLSLFEMIGPAPAVFEALYKQDEVSRSERSIPQAA